MADLGSITIDVSVTTKAIKQFSKKLEETMANLITGYYGEILVGPMPAHNLGDWTISVDHETYYSGTLPCEKCGFEMSEHRKSPDGACVVRVNGLTLRVERVKRQRQKPLPRGRAIDLTGKVV